jgi:hypothetical protein
VVKVFHKFPSEISFGKYIVFPLAVVGEIVIQASDIDARKDESTYAKSITIQNYDVQPDEKVCYVDFCSLYPWYASC